MGIFCFCFRRNPERRRTTTSQEDKDEFLELQMAKLLARRGMDEMDSGTYFRGIY